MTVIGAILQIVLLSLKSYYAKESEIKQAHADKSKEISDSIASGDISRINAAVGSVRR